MLLFRGPKVGTKGNEQLAWASAGPRALQQSRPLWKSLRTGVGNSKRFVLCTRSPGERLFAVAVKELTVPCAALARGDTSTASRKTVETTQRCSSP